ncbi:ABC transporter ATP-binding protein [Gilliamella sp. B2824]|uniref:ABC transporter ATP-binding protein n=1 Tax=Gilliamella sp. B2824 TaxID=2818019 RepID=UPI00226987A7|nr:ABC transporter ATP-binding protein [Gilliamella sp. B2824]MCX8738466.1 ABC transporter ATP-binding protein [Gilliamella sp. B2824]
MTSAIITTHNLICGYQQSKPLTTAINITIHTNDIIAILGVNGRGKSTLLNTLMGTLKPLSGTINNPHCCSFVPQNFMPNIDYKVWEIVVMGSAKKWGLFGKPDRHLLQLVEDKLAQFGLAHYSHHLFSQLSGGQKQLVLIARALMSESNILLLDEPTSALDLHNQHKVLNILSSLVQKQNLTIVFTTHDPAHAMSLANKVLLLDETGYQYGLTQTLLTETQLTQLYNITMKKIVFSDCQTIIPLYTLSNHYDNT